MNDNLFYTLVSLFFIVLVYPLYRLIKVVQQEIWMYKNRNRPRVVNQLLWKIAYSKGK